MLYGEINIGDILEWKTFGGQSTKLLVTGHGEIVKYGNKKGDDKKIIPAVYVRSLEAFDDEPQLVEATHLRQNSKRAPQEEPQQSGDGDEATTDEDSEGVDYETDPNVKPSSDDDYSQGAATMEYDRTREQAAQSPEKKSLPRKLPVKRTTDNK